MPGALRMELPETFLMIHPTITDFRNSYGRMVYEDFLQRIRDIHQERKQRLAGVRTRKQAEAYRDMVAEKTVRCFGRFPVRTPLNPVVTGIVAGPRFRIEKLYFESRPGFLVTANLYVPNGARKPAPAVLGSCGHAQEGKAAAPYQSFAQELVQAGFVVLVFDPISQGERDQFCGLCPDDTLRTSCMQAHNMIGKQLELNGEFFGSWRAWDAMRALDYLCTRPEVDSGRISMTGNSGGGTMTLWMWALDKRIRMAGVSCFVSTFLANLENELPQDAEQYPPGTLAEGLEMADFLIARAPDPAIVLAQRYCFFDRRGAEEAAAETTKIYRLLGLEKNFRFFVGNHTHGYHEDARCAMRSFFCQWGKVRQPKSVPVTVHDAPTLYATHSGQVIPEGGVSFQSLNTGTVDRLLCRIGTPDVTGLRLRLPKILGLEKRSRGVVTYRILRPDCSRKGDPVARYAVRTERGIEAILRKIRCEPGAEQSLDVEKRVTLYVPHFSAAFELSEQSFESSSFLRSPLYGVDVRGLGESAYGTPSEIFHGYGMDYMFHGLSLMLNESYLGRRVFDLLCTCDLLRQEGAEQLNLIGRGQGALLALFATVLNPVISEAELHEAPASFAHWGRMEKSDWPAANCIRGVLRHFDLPDLYKAFAPRVRVVNHCE